MTAGRRVISLAITVLLVSSGVCNAETPVFPDTRPNVFNLPQLATSLGADEKILIYGMEKGGEDPAGEPPTFLGVPAWEMHKYLGYTTVLLAAVTAVSSGSKSLHWGAAYGTAGAGVLTLTTGALAHGQRFNLEHGLFTRDNTHILLGTIGVIGCIAAVALADSEGGGGHAGAGVFGGTAMALSIITIRW